MADEPPERDLIHRAAHAMQEAAEHPAAFGLRQWSGLVIGPALLLLTLVTEPPAGLGVEGWRTAGAAGLMAVWWIAESVPIPVTALVPLALFPFLGLGSIKDVAAPYANPIVFLFLGGFVIALAMQRWGLHRRVAIGLIGAMGTRPTRIIAGFLLSGAFVSMWVSNTATALMMLPIAMSVVAILPASVSRRARNDFGTALMPGGLRRDDRRHGHAHRHAAERASRRIRAALRIRDRLAQ
jgi:sodium-dependent dicarboxylate transporter 2/3/5